MTRKEASQISWLLGCATGAVVSAQNKFADEDLSSALAMVDDGIRHLTGARKILTAPAEPERKKNES